MKGRNAKKAKMKLRLYLTMVFVFLLMEMSAQINKDTNLITLVLDENGNFPNNPKLPVLLYKNVFQLDVPDPASVIEKVLAGNNWSGSWRNGIYNFQHYHSTAHEALGVYGGWAEVQLGGPENKTVRIEKGDLVVLPAGTTHKRIDSGAGFGVVGAYPDGQSWDMNYGKPEELQKAKENIAKVKLPQNDPVFGEAGKMFDFWK
jgi:uncharacterized protein YjlB